MTGQITIVGTGKIGASVGLALAAYSEKLSRVGHDKNPEQARQAQKMGAVDRVVYNLPAAVREADLILLALPIDQIQQTLEVIAQDLKPGVVIMDTAPAKSTMVQWTQQGLPEGRYYVGLTPALNPAHLFATEEGIEAAREDLFANSVIGIVSSAGTASSALKLAADLTGLLKAEPFFLDITEVDSLTAAVQLGPQLLAACMVAITAYQPGWPEGRKLAGAAYALLTGPLERGDPPSALAQNLLHNQPHALRLVDNLVAALTAYRERIEAGDESGLVERLQLAAEKRSEWWQQRLQSNWRSDRPAEIETPSAGQQMRRWLVGERKKK